MSAFCDFAVRNFFEGVQAGAFGVEGEHEMHFFSSFTFTCLSVGDVLFFGERWLERGRFVCYVD